MLAEIAARVETPTAPGIASAIGSLINDEVLLPGAKLPTVRALASELGVSVNTMADAWRILQNHGAIETDRRRGTTVRPRRSGFGGRSWQVPVAPGTMDLDLSTGTPDATLLPEMGPILHELHADFTLTSYVDPPVLPALEDALRGLWPFEPEEVTVVDGAQDALDRTIGELVGLGDTVVVEDPTFPPLLDMLELAGADVVGVPLDAEGPRLDALTQCIADRDVAPKALVIQPRAHNPTGVHISRRRTRAIADLVSARRTIVIEDDHSGGASGVELESVAEFVPEKVVHIHSFSKSHGPDLRIAAIAGPASVVGPIVRRRQLGPSWTSRLIQEILLTMLQDARVEARIADAAAAYRERRATLASMLAEHGVTVEPGVGLNMWIPVEDEQRAVVALAAHGVGVAPGGPFRVDSTNAHQAQHAQHAHRTQHAQGPHRAQGVQHAQHAHHIRLSLGALRVDPAVMADLATTIATAARV